MKILFKYTTRSRRSNFLRGIDSIVNNIANHKDYHILISVDEDDKTMFPLPVLSCNHTYVVGSSTGKINAINRDLNEFDYDWDILVNMSDDMEFIKRGFDEAINESLKRYSQPYDLDGEVVYRWDLDQYIHFNDGNQKANVSTMHIVGRDYYNRFKYIYHPSYISLWCDVENDIVAKQLGCYKYMGDSVQLFRHLHPAWGLAQYDEQYKKTEAQEMWDKDSLTFNQRNAINFGL